MQVLKPTKLHKFFSLPVVSEEFYASDKKTLWAYLLFVAIIMALLFIPAVSKITGLLPWEFAIIVGLHMVFDLAPYLLIKGFYNTRVYGLYSTMLVLGIACLAVFFSGTPRSFFWMFYILYSGVLGTSLGLNVWSILITLLLPYVTGYAFIISGLMAHSTVSWLNLSLVPLLSIIIQVYIGMLNNKYQEVLTQKQELEAAVVLKKEQERVSRELHDGVTSDFISILYSSEKARMESASEDAELKELFGTIEATSRRGLQSLRNIVLTIDPEEKTFQYLVALCRKYIGSVSVGDGKEIRMAPPRHTGNQAMDTVIPTPILVSLYRCLQDVVDWIAKEPYNAAISIDLDLIADRLQLHMSFAWENRVFLKPDKPVADEIEGEHVTEEITATVMNVFRKRVEQIACEVSGTADGDTPLSCTVTFPLTTGTSHVLPLPTG